MRANRYVSYLAAEIEPAALSNMRSFERAAENTMEKIAHAGNRGSAGIASSALGTSIKRNTDAIVTGGAKARKELDRLNTTQRTVGRGADIMAKGFSRAADALQIVQGPLGPVAGRLSALGQVLRSLTGFTLAGVLAGGGAFALGGIATQYQRVHDKLAPLYNDQRQLNAALNDVVGIAGRTRQALEPVADLYSKLTLAGRGVGISEARVSKLVETVSKAARISGGAPETQAAGLQQFAQAFGSGQLGGDELRSIRENTLRLAKAIADGLDVPIGALKKLGKEGKLTSEVLAQALERSAKEIDAEYRRLPKRVGQSITELSNNLSVFIGRADETVGATSAIANGISLLANHLREVAVLAVTAGAALGARRFANAATAITGFASRTADAIARMRELQGLQREGSAVMLGTARAAEMRAQFVQQAAVAEQSAAAAAVRGAQAYKAQLENQLGLLDKQIVAQRKALELARTLDAASRASGGAGRADLVKAAQLELNAALRARGLTEEQIAAVNAELAAADVRLAAATQALTVANEELVVAENAAAAASTRLGKAKIVLQGAMDRVGAAASSLVGFLGGPWGVAFTAAAAWVTYLATRHDYAREAIARFKGGEEALADKLGFTTGKIREQTAELQKLTLAFLRSDIAKAKSRKREVGGQLAGDIAAAQDRGLFRGMSAGDLQKLRQLQALAESGQFDFKTHGAILAGIQERNPSAFQQGLLSRLLGNDPSRAIDDIKGMAAATQEVADAERELAEAQKEVAKGPPIKLDTGPPTKAELNAQAKLLAAQEPLDRARAELQLAMKKGPLEGETNDQYKQRIAGLIQNVQSLVDAKKAAANATASERHEQTLLNKAMRDAERGRDRGSRLANIADKYSEDTPIKRLEKLRDAAEKAKRAIDDLVGERVIDKNGDRIFSQDEADRMKAQIDAFETQDERRPVTESLRNANEELRIQRLIASGLGDQAEFIRRKVDLEKQVGPLTDEEEQSIRDQIAEQNRLNDILDRRNAIIENNARMLDAFRDSLKDAVSALLQGDIKHGFKDFFHGIYQAFADARAEEIVMKLIGDPGKKYRDEMTRGLNNSADRLTGSAGELSGSADALSAAANALANAAGAGPGAAGIGAASNLFPEFPVADQGNAGGDITAAIIDGLGPAVGALYAVSGSIDDASGSVQQIGDEIVVTARRQSAQPIGGTVSIANMLGAKLGSLIAGPDSILTKVLGQLGTALEGSQYGVMGSGLFGSAFGIEQSSLGAGIGGAIGQVAGNAIGQTIGGALGSALGPIGGVLGGVLGGTIGGLFKSTPKGSATITNISGDFVVSGNSSSAKKAAIGAADDVVGGITRILDALGGTIGNFSVSIGQRHGDYRVDPSGRGVTKKDHGAIDFDQDYEAAVKYAIMNAIQDGAIQGIRESTKRLLMAGKDLDSALDKALRFEDVFKRLKRLKDPVGAAIDELNTEFQQLIALFNEAGASAQEWSDLQELYDLERADAIKQATQSTVQLLDDFIQSMTSGPDSPLSKRTVYENAQAEVDKFRSDIAAGTPVDQDALIKALENFEQASQDLYGSRAQFYTDFSDIMNLAEQARDNVDMSTGTLPPSPFDSTPIVNQQQTTNDWLERIHGLLGGSGGGTGSGSSGGSTVNDLPAYGGAIGTSARAVDVALV